MKSYHSKPNIYVNEIVLKVSDLDRSIKFYTEIMGFSILKVKTGSCFYGGWV